jgi:16S rRNA (guanine527-N7)-methyltransferase
MTKKLEVIEIIREFYPINDDVINKLENYVSLLLEYNLKYNLIGKSTIDDVWNRHILDCAQLIKFIPDKNLKIGDFGSGAGLPAIILSIMGIKEIHLIEKSFRKCEFLQIAKDISNNDIIVHQEIAQKINPPIKFDIITSRAFAPLNNLLEIINPFLKEDSFAILPKGKNIKKEIDVVNNNSNMDYELHPSLTSSEGNILIINKFK